MQRITTQLKNYIGYYAVNFRTITLPIVLLFSIILLIFFYYIGYLGGDIFTTFNATRKHHARDHGTAALFISSDMGLKVGFGPAIANRLAQDGISVVGINALTFFRTWRSSAEADALLVDGMRRALNLPGTDRVILIGQSFGAEILQAALTRLPRELRAKVALVILIVPADTMRYRASPGDIFTFGAPAISAIPSARMLRWVPTSCIQGQAEAHSLCPYMTMPNVSRISLPGGHMLGFDPGRLYAAIAPRIRRAAAR